MSAWARRDALYALLLLALLWALVVASAQWSLPAHFNVSRAAPKALTERLAQLPSTLVVRAFAREDVNLRAAILAFFARFDGIELQLVNPDADPESARALGLRINGEMRLNLRDQPRTVALDALDDAAFARALDQLTRTGERVIGVLDLNDAKPPHQQWMARLEQQSARVLPLDLSRSGIPSNLSVLLLLGSQRALDPGQSFELQRYLENGGKLLWLLDPVETRDNALIPREPLAAGLIELAENLGLAVLSGRVSGPNDTSGSSVLSLPPDQIHLLPPLDGSVILAGAAALKTRDKARWTVETLLHSSQSLPLGLAFSHHNVRQVIVIGDQDFISDSYIGTGANLALSERLLDALDPIGQPLAAVEPADARLKLTQTRALWLSGWLLLGLPGILALVAIVMIVRRRSMA